MDRKKPAYLRDTSKKSSRSPVASSSFTAPFTAKTEPSGNKGKLSNNESDFGTTRRRVAKEEPLPQHHYATRSSTIEGLSHSEASSSHSIVFPTAIEPSGKKRKFSSNQSEVLGDRNELKKMKDGEVCNFCMQEMKVEQDPRELPCGHVFCLRCLMDDCDSRGTTSYQCVTCRKVHKMIIFSSLPSVVTDKETTLSAESCCDRCPDEPAVSYCIDCGVKCCSQHMKHHEGFFNGLHDTLDITQYAENPSLYNKVIRCEHHEKDFITMACKRCYQYNCLQCCEKITLCKGSYTDHIYHPLATIEKEIQQTFSDLLNQASEKLTEIARLDKEAWTKHDELLVKCKEMVAEVERKSKEQIEQIRTQTKQLKESIQQYKDERASKAIQFSKELMEKQGEIEEVRKSIHEFLRNKHVSQLIRGQREQIQLLNSKLSIPLGTCEWSDHNLRIGKKQRMEIEFREPGSALPHVRAKAPFFRDELAWSLPLIYSHLPHFA